MKNYNPYVMEIHDIIKKLKQASECGLNGLPRWV
jgi:hypothetical protein